MTRNEVEQMLNRLRLRHGVTLRLIDALPEAKLHERVIPNMRTPAELIVHLYGGLREMIEGVQRGEIREIDEAGIVKTMKTKADLLEHATESFDAACRAGAGLTDQQLASAVKTAWGSTPPATAMIDAVGDEFFHHRGQLYVFARALGVQPPDMWDFKGNAAEFQPAAARA